MNKTNIDSIDAIRGCVDNWKIDNEKKFKRKQIILNILYDTCTILIIIMIATAVLTNQLIIALLGLVLLKMSVRF